MIDDTHPQRAPRSISPLHPEHIESGVEAGEIGVWRWERDSGRLWWSRNLLALHRTSAERFDGRIESFNSDIHAADRGRVLAAVRRSIAERAPYHVEYRLPTPPGVEERWLEARGAVIVADGRVVGMTGICQDVTARERAKEASARLARHHAVLAEIGAGAIAGWPSDDILQRMAAHAAAALDADIAVVLEYFAADEAMVVRAAVGWDDAATRAVTLPAGAGTLLGHALRAGAPVVVDDLAADTVLAAPELRACGAASGILAVIAGPERRYYGMIAVLTRTPRRFDQADADFLHSIANVAAGAVARARHEQRFELSIGEMRHRGRNLLALILSLFNQTAAGAEDLIQFKATYEARLMALARAHSHISEGGWIRTTVRQLIGETLQPVIDRVALDGREVEIDADVAFALSLVLHELATNAAKYGALSVPQGRVRIAWESALEEGRPVYQIVWTETGGPPPAQPGRKGFGSQLVTMVVEHQLQGRAVLDFAPTGLTARLRFR